MEQVRIDQRGVPGRRYQKVRRLQIHMGIALLHILK